MKHYMFWADWKKPHRRKGLQSKNSRPKNEPGVKKTTDADKKAYSCGAPPDVIAFIILIICTPILIFYPIFSTPDAYFKVNRSTVISEEAEHGNKYHQQEDCGSFRENQSNIRLLDNSGALIVEDGDNGKEHGLGGSDGSESKLPPRPLGVTEPPCFFGTSVLGGLIVRWDMTFVGWSMPESVPVLDESADDFESSQLAPNAQNQPVAAVDSDSENAQ